jgi:dCMP deaminase
LSDTKTVLSWDLRFLDLAKSISSWSKDPSTQVGAVAVKDRRVLGTGYNGFPKGVADLPGRLGDRGEKLLRTVHAEANIITHAARHGVSLEGSTVYVWPFLPCSNCCTLLIQAGIVRVVAPNFPIPDRWEASFALSRSMFNEAKVNLTLVDVPEE